MSLIKVTNNGCHNFVDRPIELLRHQSAWLPKCCMKPLQSLFSLVLQHPSYLQLTVSHIMLTCSWPAACLYHILLCVLPHRFLSKRETARSLLFPIIALMVIYCKASQSDTPPTFPGAMLEGRFCDPVSHSNFNKKSCISYFYNVATFKNIYF